MKKIVSNSQIPRTGPRMIRGKGMKFGSDIAVRTHLTHAAVPLSPIVIISRTIWLFFITRISLFGFCKGPILCTCKATKTRLFLGALRGLREYRSRTHLKSRAYPRSEFHWHTSTLTKWQCLRFVCIGFKSMIPGPGILLFYEFLMYFIVF